MSIANIVMSTPAQKKPVKKKNPTSLKDVVTLIPRSSLEFLKWYRFNGEIFVIDLYDKTYQLDPALEIIVIETEAV